MSMTVSTGSIPVVRTPERPVNIRIPVGPPGPQGPPGKDALWTEMTQEEFDALITKDPNTLYVIME